MPAPSQIPRRGDLPEDLIARASYVGSSEHKVERWWGGLPQGYIDEDGQASRPRKIKTTICPLTTIVERDRATDWVQEALRCRQIRFVEGDKDFPKHIWHYAEGTFWFGLCFNSIAGHYKGWPIDKEERDAFFG